MRPIPIACLAALAFALPTGARGDEPAPESEPVPLIDAVKGLKGKGPLVARIEVDSKDVKGALTCTLFDEKTPVAVANFVALSRGLRAWKDASGKWVKRPLYDGTRFHRVMPGYLIQGGDPEGAVKGGPGYWFDDEIRPELVFDKGGLLAMANKGIDRQTGHGTNGSQFFVTEKATPWLNGQSTIFGQCEPVDLVRRLAAVPLLPGDKSTRPVDDLVIKHVTISRAQKGGK